MHFLPQSVLLRWDAISGFCPLVQRFHGSHQAARPQETATMSPAIEDQTSRWFTASSVFLGRVRPTAFPLHRWAGDVQEV